MKVSEHQLLILLSVARWSLNFCNTNPGGYSVETISRVYDQIINQADHAPVEVGKLEAVEE